jgi:hypothetical protein
MVAFLVSITMYSIYNCKKWSKTQIIKLKYSYVTAAPKTIINKLGMRI